ncbi:MAG: alpha/beta hydrolase [Venatoribacter sp.]
MLNTVWSSLTDFWQGDVGAIPLEELQARHEYPESKYLEIQGLKIHYRDVNRTGDPNAKVIIMLHGIFSSLHTWETWTDIISPYYRVISIDSPNFGLTGPHPLGMHTYLYSDYLNEFTKALGLEKVMLAGNSLGGWMSWEFAGRFPEKVEKIILLDSAGFFFVPPMILVSIGLPTGGWFASRMVVPRKIFSKIVGTTYFDSKKLSKVAKDRYYDLYMRAGNRDAAAEVLRFIRNKGGFKKGLMNNIKCPVLIMWGKNDAWIPPAHVELFKKALPQAEVIMYDNCGHLPMEEAAEQSAADALAFFNA